MRSFFLFFGLMLSTTALAQQPPTPDYGPQYGVQDIPCNEFGLDAFGNPCQQDPAALMQNAFSPQAQQQQQQQQEQPPNYGDNYGETGIGRTYSNYKVANRENVVWHHQVLQNLGGDLLDLINEVNNDSNVSDSDKIDLHHKKWGVLLRDKHHNAADHAGAHTLGGGSLLRWQALMEEAADAWILVNRTNNDTGPDRPFTENELEFLVNCVRRHSRFASWYESVIIDDPMCRYSKYYWWSSSTEASPINGWNEGGAANKSTLFGAAYDKLEDLGPANNPLVLQQQWDAANYINPTTPGTTWTIPSLQKWNAEYDPTKKRL